MSSLLSARHLLLLSSLSLLSACGSYDSITQKGKVDYKSTAAGKPLDVPPDLVSVTADDRFVVPDVGSRGVATASGMGAPAVSGVRAAAGPVVLPKPIDARIERNGNQRWLVVNRPAEQVWPVVREFWLQAGFQLKEEKPEIGILETDWAENRAKIPLDGIRRVIGKVFDGMYSSEELDRYRTRIERTEAGTEIYVSHRGLREVYEDQTQVRTVWTPRQSDPELEAEFLNRILAKLAGDEATQAAQASRPKAGDPARAVADAAKSDATKAPAIEARARLVRTDAANPKLQVRETFDRAWRRVGLALDRTGFTVEDRDRSKGLYFVAYREPVDKAGNRPETQPGFFARIFGAGSGNSAQVEDVRLDGRFRVVVAVADGRTDVSVLTNEGQVARPAVAERILSLLENELR